MSFKMTLKDGATVTVEFNPDSGMFHTKVASGKEVFATTWNDLRVKADVAATRAKVKVAVEFVDPVTGMKGVATGIHASQHKPLITWADGKKDCVDVREPLVPTTDVEELKRLSVAAHEAQHALSSFKRANRGDLSYSLRGAVEAAISSQVDS